MKGILLSSLLSIFIITCAALDNINGNQTIRVGETIVSARGEFEMGFFSPGKSTNRYFGIWYKKISNGTVVWVANRDKPVTTTSGVVTLNSKGIVVLANGSFESIVWSSNTSTRSTNNPMAQLLDSGNLVFRDENDNGPDNIIWQSFDYPVDTILPGMKFGIDLVSGLHRYFISWKSADDPSPGSFVHRVVPNGYPQLLLYRDSVLSYRTGPWVGAGFSGIANFQSNDIYMVQFVISPKEIYYKFELTNSSESAITRLILTPSGHTQRMIWNKQKQEWSLFLSLEVNDCDSYGLCGGNGVCNINNSPRCECLRGFNPKIPENWAAADWAGGCARRTQLDRLIDTIK